MSRVTVQPGICGFPVEIEVTTVGKRMVQVTITSECRQVTTMNDDLSCLDVMDGVLGPMTDSVVYRSATQHLKHAACPVPSAILKAIEVEAGLALPGDVFIKIEK